MLIRLKFKDNKIDVEGVATVVARAYDGDIVKMKLGRQIATVCADITDADRCIAFYNIFECCYKVSEFRGLNPDEF